MLERADEVRATFFRAPPRRLTLTPEEADSLAAHLTDLGRPLPGVNADHDTANSFTEAWQRHTGARPKLHEQECLYRLGTLMPPEPFPEGRGRVAGE